MKKEFYTFAAILIILINLNFTDTINAQPNNISVGFGPGFCSFPDFAYPGFGIRGYYGISDELRAVPDFTFYLPKKYTKLGLEETRTFWESNANAHYVFHFDNFEAYGIGGVNVSGFKITDKGWTVPTGSKSKVGIGFNLGSGAGINFNNNFGLFTEVKYAVVNKGLSHFGFTFGAFIGLN